MQWAGLAACARRHQASRGSLARSQAARNACSRIPVGRGSDLAIALAEVGHEGRQRRDCSIGLGVVQAGPESASVAVPGKVDQPAVSRFGHKPLLQLRSGQAEAYVHHRAVPRQHPALKEVVFINNAVQCPALSDIAGMDAGQPPCSVSQSSIRCTR